MAGIQVRHKSFSDCESLEAKTVISPGPLLNDGHVRRHAANPGSLKNVVLLRLILKERGVVSKRAISAIRGW